MTPCHNSSWTLLHTTLASVATHTKHANRVSVINYRTYTHTDPVHAKCLDFSNRGYETTWARIVIHEKSIITKATTNPKLVTIPVCNVQLDSSDLNETIINNGSVGLSTLKGRCTCSACSGKRDEKNGEKTFFSRLVPVRNTYRFCTRTEYDTNQTRSA